MGKTHAKSKTVVNLFTGSRNWERSRLPYKAPLHCCIIKDVFFLLHFFPIFSCALLGLRKLIFLFLSWIETCCEIKLQIISCIKKRDAVKKQLKLFKNLVSQPTNSNGVPDPLLSKKFPVLWKVMATLICVTWGSSLWSHKTNRVKNTIELNMIHII